MQLRVLLLLAFTLLSAASSAAETNAPSTALTGIVLHARDGTALEMASVIHQSKLTAVVFFSSTCPCFAAHRGRLSDIARELAPRGVRLLVVDSERHLATDAAPALAGEGLPVFRDEGGRLARALDAHFATESFVFDSSGSLRYRGGIDDERKFLGSAPKAYLLDDLRRLLDGTAPPFVSAKTLGCALRLR